MESKPQSNPTEDTINMLARGLVTVLSVLIVSSGFWAPSCSKSNPADGHDAARPVPQAEIPQPVLDYMGGSEVLLRTEDRYRYAVFTVRVKANGCILQIREQFDGGYRQASDAQCPPQDRH